jgi:lysozyme family protein
VAQIIDEILRIEGERYTDHPLDKGGPTRWGITLNTLSTWRNQRCTPEDVRELSQTEARAIYRHMYVVQPGFDQVEIVSASIAAEVIDTGVNMGQPVAGRMLQRALNAFVKPPAKLLVMDGLIGQTTLGYLRSYLNSRGPEGERVMLMLLNSQQAMRYMEICERDPTQKAFFFGWMLQRVVNQLLSPGRNLDLVI